MLETKVHIPCTDAHVKLAGILAQRSLPASGSSYATTPPSPSDTRGRKVALILHGVLAHKDQTYHKSLAAALPIDSLRFDFRANAESPGKWSMSSFDEDLLDMQSVCTYLRDQLGYTIEVIIGHSRGALDGFAFFAKHANDALPVELRIPYYVSVSGRWRMERIHDRDALYLPAFEKEGFYRWKVKVAGEKREVHIYPEHVKEFAIWPIEEYVKAFPTKTDVLLIHGTNDPTVPVADSAYYANALTGPTRRPGSFRMKLIDDADHNLRGHYPEVVSTIVTWLETKMRDAEQGHGAGAIAVKDRELQKGWAESKGKL